MCFLAAAFAAYSHPLSFGAKAGLPLTSTEESGWQTYRYGGQYSFFQKRHGFGPTVEVRLPFSFCFEADALYRRVREDVFLGPAPGGVLKQFGMRAGVWEIPLLLKHRFPGATTHFFLAAGSTLRTVGDLDVDLIQIPTFPQYPPEHLRYTVPSDVGVRVGVTAAAGISRRFHFLRLEPEVRYTHWTSKHFLATTEQAEFLLGLTFP